jgi:hypothetical protein
MRPWLGGENKRARWIIYRRYKSIYSVTDTLFRIGIDLIRERGICVVWGLKMKNIGLLWSRWNGFFSEAERLAPERLDGTLHPDAALTPVSLPLCIPSQHPCSRPSQGPRPPCAPQGKLTWVDPRPRPSSNDSHRLCVQHTPIYFCNIQMKHLQHTSKTDETFRTYSWNTIATCVTSRSTFETSRCNTCNIQRRQIKRNICNICVQKKTNETLGIDTYNIRVQPFQHMQNLDLLLQHLHETIETYIWNN